jgi:hypothetical protein
MREERDKTERDIWRRRLMGSEKGVGEIEEERAGWRQRGKETNRNVDLARNERIE